ncbi:cyanoexosortase A [Synechococcus sp. PCC 7336]|uniref:cyanoexosortase A n=1 Tax=Synechococcus sp. PCC 7336 TaxID=195250 RepID=UPI000369C337|nr:cyanoexosortase A [Synechococcus sp. PCC 7336]
MFELSNRDIWTARVQYSRASKNWLIAIFVGLVGIHLISVWSSDNVNLWSASCLFWAATIASLWRCRQALRCESSLAAIVTSFLLIAWILYKSLHLFDADIFLRVSPILSLLGFGLLASGFQGLRPYAKAFQLLGFLAFPWELLYLLDITTSTAKFSAAVLNAIGFEVQRQGFLVALPNGAIEVFNGCSGVQLIAQLMGFTWLYLCWVAPKPIVRGIVAIAAVLLGFAINGLRVTLMAVLANAAAYDWLAYWHLGDGSLLFPLAAAALFGLFLWSVHKLLVCPQLSRACV